MRWIPFLLILIGQCCSCMCRLYEYHFVEEKKTWGEAQKYCREKYTDLAKVFDMVDVRRLCNSTQNQGEAWIGLNNTGGNKMWHWSADKFILIKENKTWEQALDYCRRIHRDLVSITDPQEQGWVQEKVQNASSPFVWLGLRYTCTLDLWFWVSDKLVCYEKWAREGKTEECDRAVGMDRGGQHEWFSQRENETYNFICSKQ
ncbi:snaclec stejaggregin-B subunit beta-1-like [Archocentrus centrarchus]|uniref:snaclec stejaggregin-B subunit beta-1-like n=1 Tax=Archocentrus centrarchus TaxID=63155 RepID=UPI0011EA4D70|nr:snaclec stejaggregin-B subunit beta-1-like [Archocentrus centrarchus]